MAKPKADTAAPMSVTDAISRVEAVLADLRSASPRTVNPDGTPGTVSPFDLIESSWGNAVVNTLNPLHARRPQAALVTATAVLCPLSTLTQVTFTTEAVDTGGLVTPAADMTVNLTGFWAFTAHADGTAAWQTGSSIRLYLGASTRIYSAASVGTDQMTVSGILLGGGTSTVVRVYLYNASTVSAITANTVSLNMARISYV